ncbi:hypothetical protein PYCC9005_001469 [Savitreella phatthalungensis]
MNNAPPAFVDSLLEKCLSALLLSLGYSSAEPEALRILRKLWLDRLHVLIERCLTFAKTSRRNRPTIDDTELACLMEGVSFNDALMAELARYDDQETARSIVHAVSEVATMAEKVAPGFENHMDRRLHNALVGPELQGKAMGVPEYMERGMVLPALPPLYAHKASALVKTRNDLPLSTRERLTTVSVQVSEALARLDRVAKESRKTISREQKRRKREAREAEAASKQRRSPSTLEDKAGPVSNWTEHVTKNPERDMKGEPESQHAEVKFEPEIDNGGTEIEDVSMRSPDRPAQSPSRSESSDDMPLAQRPSLIVKLKLSGPVKSSFLDPDSRDAGVTDLLASGQQVEDEGNDPDEEDDDEGAPEVGALTRRSSVADAEDDDEPDNDGKPVDDDEDNEEEEEEEISASLREPEESVRARETRLIQQEKDRRKRSRVLKRALREMGYLPKQSEKVDEPPSDALQKQASVFVK